MKDFGYISYLLAALFSFAALTAHAADEVPGTKAAGNTEGASRSLIAYFSRADENYGVGVIQKGNTEKIAEIIAKKTGGRLFHIETAAPYPKGYKECTDTAKREKNENARPKLKNGVDRFDYYDVIYLGYPIWWGDMPMALYTFIEGHNWKGKTVIPFCTHEGSGLSGTDSKIAKACRGAVVLKALPLRGAEAQNDSSASEQAVQNWLDRLGSK